MKYHVTTCNRVIWLTLLNFPVRTKQDKILILSSLKSHKKLTVDTRPRTVGREVKGLSIFKLLLRKREVTQPKEVVNFSPLTKF